jgi:alpha-glucosidase
MTTKANNNGWWRGGVIYQIYPRSYQDSNNDGIGDLPGITQRLEHVARLGADGIWISPFFKSPMKDFGYDISDYCDVDPMFGTLADFRALVDRAHELGLKVMIDQVLSHTADVHPWFVESRASRNNPKADWYVWADAKSDGTPPNNWLSIFGGSAWQWDTRRQQYYLHNFLASQPDLNFHCPQVQDALLQTVRFWLDFGVDGYRLDTVNFYTHDAQLRDNPPRGKPAADVFTAPTVNPYSWQWHVYDKSQPENLAFLQRLRALLDEYPNTTMVGEIGDDDGLARVAEYTGGGDKLHMAYCFELMGTQRSAPYLHETLSRFDAIVGDGWPCWALGNHDVMRVASRWWGEQAQAAQLRLSLALQLGLRGTPCIYQGEELGLSEATLDFEALQDPYGIAMWPEFKGRDGCRTPMVWRDAPDGGFGSNNPWLPVPKEHRALAVERQTQHAQSLLHFYTRLLHWRRRQPALVHGNQRLLSVHEQVLAFVREHQGRAMLCVYNFSAQPVRWALPADFVAADVCEAAGAYEEKSPESGHLVLAPWGYAFCTP